MDTVTIPTSWIPRNGNYKAIHRFVVEQCHKMSIPHLLKGVGLAKQQIQFRSLTVTVLLSDRNPSYLQIGQHQFELKWVTATLGGGYWLVRCPLTRKFRWHLFVDPLGNVGTRDSLDLTYVERRMIPRKRRTWNRVKVWEELHGEKGTPTLGWFESHANAIPRRPKPWIHSNGRYHPRRMRRKRYERVLRKLNRTRRRAGG